jgi:hypothetical protein
MDGPKDEHDHSDERGTHPGQVFDLLQNHR